MGMTDQPVSPSPPPPPPPPGETPPAAVERPDWVPEQHWDSQGGAIKNEFGAHYSELANFHKTETEKRAALQARKPEDIKLDPAALPSDLIEEAKKIGVTLKVDENDPRIPVLRQLAVENGLDQDVVNKLVALDAKVKLESHAAEMKRIEAEDKKLGDNKEVRKTAVSNWVNGLKTRNEITTGEADELRMLTATADGVTLLEKLMGKAIGTVPTNIPISPPPPPPPVSVEQRWYPGMNTTQKKVS